MRADTRRVCAVLTTWPFVLSLATLIVNDAWLKAGYPGLVTGKLSDFAGIAVVALLLLARFPRHPRLVLVVIAGAFAWWKSPLSQPLIDAVTLRAGGFVGRRCRFALIRSALTTTR